MLTTLKTSWERLTAPHPTLKSLEEQRVARLATAIVVSVIGIILFSICMRIFFDRGFFSSDRGTVTAFILAALLLAYWRIRTGDYRGGILMIIGMDIAYCSLAPVFTSADPTVVFLLAGAPLAAAIFLSLRAVAWLSVICVVLAMIVGNMQANIGINAAVTLGVQSAALVLFINLRNTLEAAIARAVNTAAEAEAARQAIEQASKQREVLMRDIKALSSPVIPLMDGILLLPLIGTLDSHRAQDVMRSLLAGISQHRARTVLLDITGVPMIDSAVAQYLNQMIMAARLKGTRCIVTGINDTVAQTIVDLGIDWRTVETRRDLQAGLGAVLGDAGDQMPQA